MTHRSGDTFTAEMHRMRTEHEANLRNILEENKKILQDRIALCADPKHAAQFVFELAQVQIRLEKQTLSGSDLTAQETLQALDDTENWYKLRGYDYPFPERIAEQRAYFRAKLKQR